MNWLGRRTVDIPVGTAQTYHFVAIPALQVLDQGVNVLIFLFFLFNLLLGRVHGCRVVGFLIEVDIDGRSRRARVFGHGGERVRTSSNQAIGACRRGSRSEGLLQFRGRKGQKLGDRAVKICCAGKQGKFC